MLARWKPWNSGMKNNLSYSFRRLIISRGLTGTPHRQCLRRGSGQPPARQTFQQGGNIGLGETAQIIEGGLQRDVLADAIHSRWSYR